MKFSERTTTKKGDLGELLVDNYLKSRNVIPYKPDADQAHPFDRLCASADKKNIHIVEVKSKARRKYYPDTGINIKHYNDYQHIQAKYGINVYLFFVDEELKQIYGGLLNDLCRECQILHKTDRSEELLEYPWKHGRIIYFPLERMTKISDLDSESVSKLRNLTTKQEAYIQ